MAIRRGGGNNRPSGGNPRPAGPRPTRAAGGSPRPAAPTPARPTGGGQPRRAAAAPARPIAGQRRPAPTAGAPIPDRRTTGGAPTSRQERVSSLVQKGKEMVRGVTAEKGFANLPAFQQILKDLKASGANKRVANLRALKQEAMGRPGGTAGSPGATAAGNDSYKTNAIGQYARTADMYGMGTADQGVFSGASWNQAKEAGFTDDQIKDYLSGGNTSLMLGERVKDVVENYDKYMKPVVPNMESFTDPRSGDTIGASTASKPNVFFSPVSMSGIKNMWGNAMDDVHTSQVIGDGVDWSDPKNAGALGNYYSREGAMRALNSAYAMSTANPDLQKNMAAFIDSGHVESLLTGRTPTALPSGFAGLFNPAMTGPTTSWSKAYADQMAYKAPWMK